MILGKQKQAARLSIIQYLCIYVQGQKQHNSKSMQPSIFINRSNIFNKIFW